MSGHDASCYYNGSWCSPLMDRHRPVNLRTMA